MPPFRDHDLVRRSDRRSVHAAQLFGEELEQPWQAGRLDVVRAVVVDGGPHPRFQRLRRVEADVPLIQPKRIPHAVHHVADADDARERHGVEVGGHLGMVP